MPEVIEHSNADIYAIVRIEDPDEGRHGKVASLEIVDGDAEAHFRIRQPSIDQPNEFNIEVLRLLDREISPYGYNLTLKVKKFLKVHIIKSRMKKIAVVPGLRDQSIYQNNVTN